MDTLPDYLRNGLDIVFVGLNPSLYSARVGRYFANPRNRFWAALNRSSLVGHEVSPELDNTLLKQGIGFTDVVKRPTAGGSEITAKDFRHWAPALRRKLEECEPLIVCFHGLTAYAGYLRGCRISNQRPSLGLQTFCIGDSRVFVVPNPSPANAKYSLDVLVEWYCRLDTLRKELKGL